MISVLDSSLCCVLLPSEGDKPAKVTCQDPWQPELKMKEMKRDGVLGGFRHSFFKLPVLLDLHSDTRSTCANKKLLHVHLSTFLVREELWTINVAMPSLGLAVDESMEKFLELFGVIRG